MSQDNKTQIIGYTKEKLYDLLPAVYRQRDTKEGKQLEDMIRIIAEQVAILEKDIGGLYDNWFIETCDEWVTSYIADLLGAKSLSASKISSLSTTESVSQRAYIANTIGYRRRKGTLSMLEQLARDITQWNAKAVEFFQLLSTTQNINHIRLANHRTPDLKDMSRLDLLNTPFDTMAHTVEVRHISSGRGYYNIQNIGIFLWRLQAFPSINTHAFKIDEKNFTFNPFGYKVPIFNLPLTETLSSHLAEEVNVPAPIRRRALYDNLEQYYGKNRTKNDDEILADNYDDLDKCNDKSLFLTVKYDGETKWQNISARDILIRNLLKPCIPEGGKVAIDPELGKIAFSKNVKDVVVNYYYGFSGKIGGGFYSRPEYDSDFSDKPIVYKISKKQVFVWNKILSANPEECSHLREILRNDFSIAWVNEGLTFEKTPDERTITMSDGDHSLSISLGNGNTSASLKYDNIDVFFDAREDQDGTIYISKNKVYGSVNEAIIWWKKNRNQHAIFEIIDSEIYGEDIVVNLPAGFTLAIRAEQEKRPILRPLRIQGEKGSRLILDGLWIINNLINNTINNQIIMIDSGDMESLTIRHCTLVPGNDPNDKKVGISIKGGNDGLKIVLDHTISSRINTFESDAELNITDSIIDGKGEEAISCNSATIQNTTIFGKTRVDKLNLASNTIFTDIVKAKITQQGCVRFSYIPPKSKTPRRYMCLPKETSDDPESAKTHPRFTSLNYGDPGYAQLHKNVDKEIFEGADNGAEMGAFNHLYQPQRLADLKSNLDGYLRFGLEAGVFLVT